MLLSDAHKSDQGFTLIESLIIVSMIGILAAIAAPSFLGSLNNSRLKNALSATEGALKEAQREAIKKSESCVVYVFDGGNAALTNSEDLNGNGALDSGEDLNGNGVLDENGCLVTGNRKLENVSLSRPPAISTITFDFKGRTNLINNAGTIVFSTSDSSQQKCLVISQGLGIIRTGTYINSSCSTP